MNEFTPEWIEKQRERLIKRENFFAWDNYISLQALDEIDRLQAIIELADLDYESEHEAKENLQMATDTVIACLQSRVQELECQLKSKQIVIESKEQTIREFAEKMLDLRKR